MFAGAQGGVGHQLITGAQTGNADAHLLQRRCYLHQLRLDLTRLDTVTAQLDLLIQPAKVLIIAAGQLSRTVAGAVVAQFPTLQLTLAKRLGAALG